MPFIEGLDELIMNQLASIKTSSTALASSGCSRSGIGREDRGRIAKILGVRQGLIGRSADAWAIPHGAPYWVIFPLLPIDLAVGRMDVQERGPRQARVRCNCTVAAGHFSNWC